MISRTSSLQKIGEISLSTSLQFLRSGTKKEKRLPFKFLPIPPKGDKKRREGKEKRSED
jgi:hypothetical protein